MYTALSLCDCFTHGHQCSLLLHSSPDCLPLQVYDYFTFNIDVLKGQIQAYDPQNFNVGIAKQSGLVPLLLAPIWLLFPYLQVIMVLHHPVHCHLLLLSLHV